MRLIPASSAWWIIRLRDAQPFEDAPHRGKGDPEARFRGEERRRALHDALALAELCEPRVKTQTELAPTLDVPQPNISQLVRKGDLYVSTLRDYVEALGGRPEINAVLPDTTAGRSTQPRHSSQTRRYRPASITVYSCKKHLTLYWTERGPDDGAGPRGGLLAGGMEVDAVHSPPDPIGAHWLARAPGDSAGKPDLLPRG
jgi:hypothetical protein